MLIMLILMLMTISMVSVVAQSLRWEPYKTVEKNKVTDVRYDKDSILVVYKTIRLDTANVGDNHFERTWLTTEARTYAKDSVHSVWFDSAYISSSISSVQKLRATITADKKQYIDTSIVVPLGIQKIYGEGAKSDRYANGRDTSQLPYETRRSIYDVYYQRLHSRPRFFFGISFTPVGSYRIINVNDPSFTDSKIVEQRNNSEHALMGYIVSLPIGIAVGKYSRYYLELLKAWQGFRSASHDIDWATGLPRPDTRDHKYRFDTWGVGIGVTRSKFQRTFNLVVDAGAGVQLLSAYRNNDLQVKSYFSSNPETEKIHHYYITGKFGLGMNARLQNSSSLRFIPTFFYHFKTLSKEVIATRLISYGIAVSYTYEYKKHISRIVVKTKRKSNGSNKEKEVQKIPVKS